MKVNFENTKVAFQYRSSLQLLKAYAMFTAMNQKWLVNTGSNLVHRISKWNLNSLVTLATKPTIYDLFVGGLDLEAAKPNMELQKRFNVQTVLDYGVEAKNERADFISIQEEIIKSIDFASKHSYVEFIVLKLSGLTDESILDKIASNKLLSSSEEASWDYSLGLIHKICDLAVEKNVALFIDAEESWIQKPLDDLVLDLMRKYNKTRAIVWCTLQMYRVGRLDYLTQLKEIAKSEGFILGLKLVRGAYMEKERKRAKLKGYLDPILKTKEETDKAYNEAIKFSLENSFHIHICVATHNERSCYLAMKLMNDNGLESSTEKVCFSQLYGMGDYITYNMAEYNYNVSKYMPYGKVLDVIPYLLRRAEENTSVAGQVSRELSLLQKEIKRRNLNLISG